jgi:hypothetical protein
MTDEDAPLQIPNPYLAALRSARQSASPSAHALAEGLRSVKSAMEGNCWQSSVADQFFSTLTQQETTLKRCQTNAMDDFDEAIAGQPEKVAENSWQTHWHNLAR